MLVWLSHFDGGCNSRPAFGSLMIYLAASQSVTSGLRCPGNSIGSRHEFTLRCRKRAIFLSLCWRHDQRADRVVGGAFLALRVRRIVKFMFSDERLHQSGSLLFETLRGRHRRFISSGASRRRRRSQCEEQENQIGGISLAISQCSLQVRLRHLDAAPDRHGSMASKSLRDLVRTQP
jgi:hypothetical protein